MNNYIVLEDINSGNFGKVQKIKNKFTNKILAVKIEKKNYGTLEYEAKIYNILSKLTNIPVIRSFKCDDINNYLFMDLMDYNLKYVKENKFSNKIEYIELCKSIIINLIIAMKSIHDKNIIHRDLKPENICFSNNIIKIIDFGLSKMRDNTPKKISNIIGTPNYISLNVLNLNSPDIYDELESISYIFLYMICDDTIFTNYCHEDNIDKKNLSTINKYIQHETIQNIIKNHINICRSKDKNYKTIYNDLIQIYKN